MLEWLTWLVFLAFRQGDPPSTNIIEAILDGRHSATITLAVLMQPFAVAWKGPEMAGHDAVAACLSLARVALPLRRALRLEIWIRGERNRIGPLGYHVEIVLGANLF